MIPGVAAYPLEGALLDHAQELRLQDRRQLADLIEKEGAAVGEREHAVALGDSTRKGAALVTEKFAPGQFRHDGRAVKHHDRPLVLARVQVMHQMRDQFFSRTALAGQQHARIRILCRFDDEAQQ